MLLLLMLELAERQKASGVAPEKPTTADVVAARLKAGLSIQQSADLAQLGTTRSWVNSESGPPAAFSTMPPHRWELFQLKTGTHRKYNLVARSTGLLPAFAELSKQTPTPSSEEIKTLRLGKIKPHLAQAKLAVLAGVSNPATWSGYESKSGKVKMDSARWQLLLLKVGQHPDWRLEPKGQLAEQLLAKENQNASTSPLGSSDDTRNCVHLPNVGGDVGSLVHNSSDLALQQAAVSHEQRLDALNLIHEALAAEGLTIDQLLYYLNPHQHQVPVVPITDAARVVLDQIQYTLIDNRLKPQHLITPPRQYTKNKAVADARSGAKTLEKLSDARFGERPVRYRLPTGEGWSLRGNMPTGFKLQIAGGKALDNFEVDYRDPSTGEVWKMGEAKTPEWLKSAIRIGELRKYEHPTPKP